MRAPFALLTLALAGHLLVDLGVILKDTSPLVYDQAGYFEQAVRYLEVIRHPPEGRGLVVALLEAERLRPPVPSLAGAGALAMGGMEPDGVAMVSLLALLILALAVFALGRRLAGPWEGLVAALLTLAMPMIAGHSRLLMADLPLTAAVAASVLAMWWALGRAPASRVEPGPWVGVGLVWGVGLLIKVAFPVFLVGPVALEILAPHGRLRRQTVVSGMAIALVSAGALALPWYGTNASILWGFYRDTGHLSWTMHGMEALSGQSLIRYLSALPGEQAGWPLTALAVASLGLVLWRRPPGAARVLVALAVPWLILMFLPLRTPRNTMPALPFLALTIILAVRALPPGRPRRGALAALALLAPAQLWAIQALPAQALFPSLEPAGGDYRYERHMDAGILRPRVEDWGSRAILAALPPAPEARPILLVTAPRGLIYNPLRIEALVRGVPLEIQHLDEYTFLREGPEGIEGLLDRADYLLVSQGGAPSLDGENVEGPEAVAKWLVRHNPQLRLLRSLALPDGSQVTLLARQAPWPNQQSPP